MSFKILYVEDEPRSWEIIFDAVQAHNKRQGEQQLSLEWARTPTEMQSKLRAGIGLVLADVYFPVGDDFESDEVDLEPRITDIIKYVREWSLKEGLAQSLPVIAWSGIEESTFQFCRESLDDLYDIWDKSGASPAYVAWRLTRIAAEIARDRPGTTMQQLIRSMTTGASWHTPVVDMVHFYGESRSERDQIEGAGSGIHNIADVLGVYETCKSLWQAVMDWEALSRAVSRKVRGHARHLINVFWMGYYLLHHALLAPWFRSAWVPLIRNRQGWEAVSSDVDPLEALSVCWFFAGLFHDAAGCVEKAPLVKEWQESVLRNFGDLVSPWPETPRPTERLIQGARELMQDMGKPLGPMMEPLVLESIDTNYPDHGIVAGVLIREKIASGRMNCYAREAARAMALHNLIPRIAASQEGPISWEREPIACLLLLCDQIQTWERERGDATQFDDAPVRAELTDLRVSQSGGRALIEISVDYIAPSHVIREGQLFKREKRLLEDVLRDNPGRALRKIASPWPFDVEVHFTFSGKPLSTQLLLGKEPAQGSLF